MLLDDVLSLLRRAGLARTHAVFSTDYLGLGPRYYDHLLASRREPAISALVCLMTQLLAILRSTVPVTLTVEDREEMERAVELLWSTVQRRCCKRMHHLHRPQGA